MAKIKKILIIADVSYNPIKMFLNQMPKLAKGFLRLGHDVQIFSYCNVIRQLSPLKSKSFCSWFYKDKTDDILIRQIRNYNPDIIYVSFPAIFDADSVRKIKDAAQSTIIIGADGDPWPKLQKGRIETAQQCDILTATNDGVYLQDYRDAGVPLCVFMPNICDPDIDHRYNVGPEWKTDILWTGKVKHHADTSEDFREKLVNELARRNNCSLYGCLGRPKIGGVDYLYAISGAKIGVNVNAYGPIKFCHSDRLTQYLACGTFVMAKRFEGCDRLYKDNLHLRYFDTPKEFFSLADWYLNHEEERQKIADSGMRHIHTEFNGTKIAGYILELVEKGSYRSPWTL